MLKPSVGDKVLYEYEVCTVEEIREYGSRTDGASMEIKMEGVTRSAFIEYRQLFPITPQGLGISALYTSDRGMGMHL